MMLDIEETIRYIYDVNTTMTMERISEEIGVHTTTINRFTRTKSCQLWVYTKIQDWIKNNRLNGEMLR